jgi:hypothetical protein
MLGLRGEDDLDCPRVGGTGVPAPVRRFIASHIVSVAQLEVLLLLRAAADKAWTADEVARALVTQSDAAAGWLENLRDRGLASHDGGLYRYSPSSRELDRTIDALAESYANYRVAVISIIFARPSERITSFADAFRIRRKG